MISSRHLDRDLEVLRFSRRQSGHESTLDKVHLRLQRRASMSKEKRWGGGSEPKKEEGTCKFCSLSFPLDQMKQHYLGHIEQKCKLASDDVQKSEPFYSVSPPSAQEVHAPPSPPQTPPACGVPSAAANTSLDIKPFLRLGATLNPMSIPPPLVTPPTTFVPPLFLSTHCEDRFDAYEDSCPTFSQAAQLTPSKQKVGRQICLARS